MRRTTFTVGCIVATLLWHTARLHATDFFDKQTELAFPVDLGKAYHRVDTKKYDDERLGVYVGYNAEGAKASVYIYDYGITDIGAGIRSEAVRQHWLSAKQDIESVVERGQYRSLKWVSGDDVIIDIASGTTVFCKAFMTFREVGPQGQESQLMHSELYLTGYKDRFLKVRFTYGDDNKRVGPDLRDAFLSELCSLLK